MAIDQVCKIGKHVPVLGRIFRLCEDILGDVARLKDKADDVLEAGRRVVDVLRFLENLLQVRPGGCTYA